MEQRAQHREMLSDGSNWPKHLNLFSEQHRRESVGWLGWCPVSPAHVASRQFFTTPQIG